MSGAAGGGGIGAAGIEVGTAIIGWFTALVAAYAGWRGVRAAKRAQVSGDAKEAAEQRAAARRDAVAEWQTIATERGEALDKCEERRLSDAARFEERIRVLEATHIQDRLLIQQLQRESEDDRTVRLIHATWDWEAVEEASRAGIHLRPAPPLLPQRVDPPT